MAKNSWNDYSATAGSNTDVGGISIAEGMSPSSVNNAMREMLKQTADVVAGTTTLTSLSLTKGIFADGTNSAPSLTNSGDLNTGLYFSGADEVSVTTGGTQRLSVDASGHLNHNGSASADINALTSATTITIDMDTAQNHSVTLAHNTTFANPTNMNIGQTGSVIINQDGTGSRTASFGAYWKFAGGTAPTLTTTASAVDRIDYIIVSASLIHGVISLNVS